MERSAAQSVHFHSLQEPRSMRWTRRAATMALAGALATAVLPARAAGALGVEESLALPVPPAKVWAVIGDFGALGWHPVVAATRITQGQAMKRGAVRDITTKDGAHIVEALDAFDASGRTMTYHFVQAPLPVQNYVSTLKVVADGQGSRIVWSSRFDRDPAAADVDDEKARTIVRGIYQAGFDGLRKHFSGSAS